MTEFSRRLGFTVLYFLGSAYAINSVMGLDRGYRGNWLFVFTGKIAWGIETVVKIAFFAALAAAALYIVVKAIELYESMSRESEEESLRKNNETVAERNRAAWAMEVQRQNANSIEEVRREKIKAREYEEHLKQLEAKRIGPRSEDDAIEKALSGMKFGGLE
jgi:3-methyladenine DNA glycosylase Mpg